MNTKLLAALATVVVIGFPWGAQADQITLGASAGSTFTFVGDGASPPSTTVTSTGATGSAFFDAFTGTYTFSAFSFAAGPEGFGGNFPLISQSAATFSYSDGTNSLTANVLWTRGMQDDSPTPSADGILKITSISGNAAFDGAFGPVGQPDPFDITFANMGSTFDSLMRAGATVTDHISSGEVVPGPTAGTGLPGLILAGGFLYAWRRSRRTNRDVPLLAA